MDVNVKCEIAELPEATTPQIRAAAGKPPLPSFPQAAEPANKNAH